MGDAKRIFIFGAGFSKPAGMPLATEILPLLQSELQNDEMLEWLDGMRERLVWLAENRQQATRSWLSSVCRRLLASIGGNCQEATSFALNIEQVFHYAYFDSEVHRLLQHLECVGRGQGPGTAWNHAKSIGAWLRQLEDALQDVILKADRDADLHPITRWAESVSERDAILTFNYDTVVERALAQVGRTWNHGTGRANDEGIPVFKLHGSIDWIVAHRSESFCKLDLLFDKKNTNCADGMTGHVEDDYRLWRCRKRDQLENWIKDRDIQKLGDGTRPLIVGIAGLGAYKELHQIPGLGRVWAGGMRALYEADLAIVVGFSMSDFDAMAQLQFAEAARNKAHGPLRVIVIDPFINEASKERFRRVFRLVNFEQRAHETFDWSTLA